MWPAAIVLKYSIENIWNDVHQKIIIYEKSQFDSLVWGSLTLTPITAYKPDGTRKAPQHNSRQLILKATRLTMRMRNANCAPA